MLAIDTALGMRGEARGEARRPPSGEVGSGGGGSSEALRGMAERGDASCMLPWRLGDERSRASLEPEPAGGESVLGLRGGAEPLCRRALTDGRELTRASPAPASCAELDVRAMGDRAKDGEA